MNLYGIDISRWQKGINLSQGELKKNDISFAILKCGGGDSGLYKDGCFEDFYKQLNGVVPLGTYFFSNATSETAAIKEAQKTFELINGKTFKLGVYMDVESKAMQNLSKDALTSVILAYFKELERLGVPKDKIGIYSSTYWFKSEIDDSKLVGYIHWIANWSKNTTPITLPNGVVSNIRQISGGTPTSKPNVIGGKVCDLNILYDETLWNSTETKTETTQTEYVKPATKEEALDKIKNEVKPSNLNGTQPQITVNQEKPIIASSKNLLRKTPMSRGTQVKNLQNTLNYLDDKYSLGFEKLAVDGCFGNKTESALKIFQERSTQGGKPLVVDGIYGNNSMIAMSFWVNR